jgi:hypothetical protein
MHQSLLLFLLLSRMEVEYKVTLLFYVIVKMRDDDNEFHLGTTAFTY